MNKFIIITVLVSVIIVSSLFIGELFKKATGKSKLKSQANKNLLVIFILTVQSSYSRNIEEPVKNVPDTIQFWIPLNIQEIWRIRTYAIDHDIHVYQVKLNQSLDSPVNFAVQSTQKSYSDIIKEVRVIEIIEVNNTDEVKNAFAKANLPPNLELKGPIVFWNPDNAKYKSISTPMQVK
ncbi:hypothetical protein COY95_01180 [Candidatus Woesearchaeota archaeon CG_4_10_14_0_8_um_filter_47_5]|nr:MAG: hypothetical protein COY95_01180 [Candidatus Woesearchaeota archaeon CG_4_10_14_0_8_um_filter_47_5]